MGGVTHKLEFCTVFVGSTRWKGRQVVQKYGPSHFYISDRIPDHPNTHKPYIKSYNLMHKRGPPKVLQRSTNRVPQRSKTVTHKNWTGPNLAYEFWTPQNHKSLYKSHIISCIKTDPWRFSNGPFSVVFLRLLGKTDIHPHSHPLHHVLSWWGSSTDNETTARKKRSSTSKWSWYTLVWPFRIRTNNIDTG